MTVSVTFAIMNVLLAGVLSPVSDALLIVMRCPIANPCASQDPPERVIVEPLLFDAKARFATLSHAAASWIMYASTRITEYVPPLLRPPIDREPSCWYCTRWPADSPWPVQKWSVVLHTPGRKMLFAFGKFAIVLLDVTTVGVPN